MGRREGFTLVEILFAVVLLGTVLASLGSLTYATARRSLAVTDGTVQQAFTLESINRLIAMNYDSLRAVTSSCDTASSGTRKFRRCYTVSTSGRRSDVTLTITPLQSGSFAKTFVFSRALSGTSNPLNMP